MVLCGGANVQMKETFDDKEMAIIWHDMYNFQHPNSAVIDSVLIDKKLDHEKKQLEKGFD